MSTTHDVIVIGGGINGTGVARDCALRGLRVALFEKNDLAFGASGNNSGMIHGGARYLVDHPEVTEQSCRDSGYIQAIAPNLLFRIPFLFPIPKGKRAASLVLDGIDAFFSFYDRYQPLKRGKRHTRLTESEALTLEPGLAGPLAGAITFDEWGTDGMRLCVLNALDAEEHGAAIHVHHEVTSLLRERDGEGAVTGVAARDTLTGARVTATAKVIVNATGAWSPVVAALAKAKTKLRPGKGIHVVYDRRVSNYAVVSNTIDDRQIFVMPWGNVSWIGTTDDDFYGDLDHLGATTDEVRYLVQAIAQVLPGIRDARVIGTTAGVRPTLYEYGPLEDKLSREHAVVDHGATDGVPGLYSMVGGKLASFRIFAEEASDVVARALGNTERSRTHERPLPGGEAICEPAPLAAKHGVPEPAVRRLVYRHGMRAELILARASAPEKRGELAVVCACEPVLECEVRHACQKEHARTLDDVARRTRLGLGACGGLRCAHRGAQLVAEEHGLRPQQAHAMAARFLVDRYRSRAPALDGAQVMQEELLAARVAQSGLLARDADGEPFA